MIYSGKPSGTLKKGLIDFFLSLEFSFVHLCKNGTVWYFLHLVQFRLDFIMEASTMNPDQTAPKRSVIWVHIGCSIDYPRVKKLVLIY